MEMDMKRYIHRPLNFGTVEAIQWTGDNTQEILDFFKEKLELKHQDIHYVDFHIEGEDGYITVYKGDFIFRAKAEHKNIALPGGFIILNKDHFNDEFVPEEEADIEIGEYLKAKAVVMQYESKNARFERVESPNSLQGREDLMLVAMDEKGYYQLVYNDKVLPCNVRLQINDDWDSPTTVTATFKVAKGRLKQ